MADYSTASSNAQDSLANAADGGMVEEYQVGNRRVRRGRQTEQIKGAALLEGLAARRSAGGLFRLAKFTEPKN